MFEVKINQVKKLTDEVISDVLCCAFEGGSNYWCVIKKYGNPDNIKCEQRYLDLPLSEKGFVMIGTVDDGIADKPIRLDRKSIAKGLQLMQDKYPEHFNNILDDNFDAETGDVMLQMAVFKELVYG